MSLSVFDFDEYKSYLNAFISALPKRGYGFKTRIADSLGCKTAYVAQVLNGLAHFSPEQAESLNSLLGHREEEADFFVLLVHLARAGTESLRKRYLVLINERRARQSNLKQRFRATTVLEEKDLIEFFSLWYINAVHIATTIPRLKTRNSLMKALGLSEELLNASLKFLTDRGLLEEKSGRLEPGPTRIFIGKDSAVLKVHHANWRQKAIQALYSEQDSDLHFTSVYSLSSKDAAKIRERLIREIESVRETVKLSPEEELHTLTLDFFRIDGKS